MNEGLYTFKKAIVAKCQRGIFDRFPQFTPIIFFLSRYRAKVNTYTVVTVKGYNFFPNNTQILFGPRVLPVSFYGSTSISFVVPMDLYEGKYELYAANITNFAGLYPVTKKISESVTFELFS
jgi:hypothetical protein